MTLVDAATGEVLAADDVTLEELASTIRAAYCRSRDGLSTAIDAYLVVGQALLTARQMLPSNEAFGAWFSSQQFGFTRQWAHVLRQAAEHEPTVRELSASQLADGKAPNMEKLVKQARALAVGTTERTRTLHVVPPFAPTPDETPSVFPCVVVDPPWQYGNTATRGAAEDHYSTMSMDELTQLDVPADENAHLYLWVTNGFLREGFALIDAWGFTYKACLTWCKPQIGMGNWFRNATEHIYFAVRGSLPTQRNDVSTWFVANRTRHSAKPERFYDLVESCSPGPRLEMFARRRRLGWHTWGDEA